MVATDTSTARQCGCFTEVADPRRNKVFKIKTLVLQEELNTETPSHGVFVCFLRVSVVQSLSLGLIMFHDPHFISFPKDASQMGLFCLFVGYSSRTPPAWFQFRSGAVATTTKLASGAHKASFISTKFSSRSTVRPVMPLGEARTSRSTGASKNPEIRAVRPIEEVELTIQRQIRVFGQLIA